VYTRDKGVSKWLYQFKCVLVVVSD
jgi:hypothetical protein